MKQDELRQKLIDGAIHVIANDGLDKATTKHIGRAAMMNEVYIYRYFEDKEDLFAKTFDYLDEMLCEKIMQHLAIMDIQDMTLELRCRFFFFSIWSFLLGSRDKCLAYTRYYYSPYFTKYSYTTHKHRYQPLLEKITPAFKEEADVWMILNHVLNVMLDFAVKVHNGQMPNEDNYTEHVFRVIYVSVKQYFKQAEKGDS